MTKDEAEARVRECKERVVTTAREFRQGGAVASLFGAVVDLAAAESALASLDKPRLLRPEAVFVEVDGKYWCVPELIAADRADILAQAEKLPRYAVTFKLGGPPLAPTSSEGHDWISLSDLRKLLEGK